MRRKRRLVPRAPDQLLGRRGAGEHGSARRAAALARGHRRPARRLAGGFAAEALANGAIVGWLQGRSEFGPRALGNRSILADPRPVRNKER
jgi:predicted NodU family carbamoyl transferase